MKTQYTLWREAVALLTPEQRGNFTDLKVKGLLTHLCEDSDGFRTYNWYRIDMTSAIATPTPNQEGA